MTLQADRKMDRRRRGKKSYGCIGIQRARLREACVENQNHDQSWISGLRPERDDGKSVSVATAEPRAAGAVRGEEEEGEVSN